MRKVTIYCDLCGMRIRATNIGSVIRPDDKRHDHNSHGKYKPFDFCPECRKTFELLSKTQK